MMRYSYMPIGMDKIKSTGNTKYWQGCRANATLIHVYGRAGANSNQAFPEEEQQEAEEVLAPLNFKACYKTSVTKAMW